MADENPLLRYLAPGTQNQATMAGLGALAQALLAGGAPTTTPGGGLAAAGQGFGGFSNAYNSRMNSGLQQAALGMQLQEAQRKQTQDEQTRQAQARLTARLTSPGGDTLMRNPQMASADPNASGAPPTFDVAQAMRNPSFLGDMIGASGGDPTKVMGMLQKQEVTTPKVEEFFGADGRPYKAQFVPGRGWQPVGGSKTDLLSPEAVKQRMDIRASGKTDITIPIGGDNSADAKLRLELSKKEGERWSELQGAGLTASGLNQDFQLLDQLMTMAPQGPISGRIAEMIPGVSSAGDAFQSVVKRVAPSLRTPGSGSTSDIEYEGMLQSLPRLRSQPEANRAIAEMMKAKAGLNVERAQVVTDYQNEEIDAKTARSKLAELNKRSIMSPEIKKAIDALGGGKPTPPKVGDVVDGYEYRGGDPSNQMSWRKAR